MKTEELKTGMAICFKDGTIGHVLRNTEFGDIIAGGTWFSMRKETYIKDWCSGYAIDKIYQPLLPAHYLKTNFDERKFTGDSSYDLIWSIEEINKETVMTIAEIEKKLGIKNLKIVKDN